MVIVRNLVSQLHWGRHLDRASPIRVHVAQVVSQSFQLLLRNIIGLI